MTHDTNIKKVISVSMNRSGSTFFVTTLSTLPNIVGDYEIQVVNDIPTPFHRSLCDQSVEEIFSSIVGNQKNINVCVSKIVIAPQHEFSFSRALPLLLAELQKMSIVVVIIRPWYEQFYSKYLGGGHLTSDANRLPANLKNFYAEKDFFEKRFEMHKRNLDAEHLIQDLKKREEISLNLLDPISRLDNSILLEYENLSRFLKSFALENTELSHCEIENYVNNAPTKKLYSPLDENVFLNFSEIKKIRDFWNKKYLENMSFLKDNAKAVFE